MRYNVTYRGYQQSGGVMSLPPDPPLSTSLSHLVFKEICPIDGGNYKLQQLPRTTKHHWKQFKHDHYFGYEWVEAYIKQFDDIKDVFQSKFTGCSITVLFQLWNIFIAILAISAILF